MSTIDKSRFAQTMTVTRLAKTELDEHGQSRRWGAKRFKPNQIVLESDEFIFVARTPVEEGSSVPTLVTLDPSWSLMEQFASEKTGRVQRTGDAARDAARFAARFAAGDAAAAWVAAWFGSWAAEALVCRDLIDEATAWNQEAYDCLTGPWRRVIGPVHPEDEVLR